MTPDEFEGHLQSTLDEVMHMTRTKGKEYANDPTDRFGNFNRQAIKLRLPREKVWQVYFTKHLDSIESFIDNGVEFSDESIHGRIVDAITYLALLDGMILERKLLHNKTRVGKTL